MKKICVVSQSHTKYYQIKCSSHKKKIEVLHKIFNYIYREKKLYLTP